MAHVLVFGVGQQQRVMRKLHADELSDALRGSALVQPDFKAAPCARDENENM